MAILLSRSAWAKISFFLIENGIFLLQNVFVSDSLARIRNQRVRIDPCAKFQLNWTKDKGTRILTWNDTKYNDVIKTFTVLRDFVPEYQHAKFGCNWTTNKAETGL